MNVGIISDIHGNKVALDAVLTDMPSVDALICLGDIVGYGPKPSECVETIRDEADGSVIGNHGLALLNGYEKYRQNSMAYEGLAHAENELSKEQRDWLQSLPEMDTFFDGQLRAVHSHPDPEVRWGRKGYVRSGSFPQMPSYLDDGEDFLTMGHTHVQHGADSSQWDNHGIILNPGSVGQPRDNDPRAAYAVIDLDELDWEEHRVEYDIGTVQNQIQTAGLPTKTGQRLENGD